MAAPVREALGLRAVLRPRRLPVPRGRAPVPVRDPRRLHPRPHRRPDEPPAPGQAAVSALGGGHHPLHQHPRRAEPVHRLLHPEALRRLRAPVPRGAAALSGQQGVAARGAGSTRSGARGRGDESVRPIPTPSPSAGRAGTGSSSSRCRTAYNLDLEGSRSRCEPARGGRYVIATPTPTKRAGLTGGRVGALDQELDTGAPPSPEGESRAARVRAEVRHRGRPGSDGCSSCSWWPPSSWSISCASRVHALAVPEQYQVDYDEIVVGIDRGLSGVIRGPAPDLHHQRPLHVRGLLLFHVKYPLARAGSPPS